VDRLPELGTFRAPRLTKVAIALVVLGVFGLAWSAIAYGPDRMWLGFLQALLVPTYVALGGLFYLSVNSVAGAVWIQPVRRIIEGLSSGLFVSFAGFAVFALIGSHYIYPWIAAPFLSEAHDSLFHLPGGSKQMWMNWPRFIATNFVFFGVWCFLRHRMLRLSFRQDAEGDSILDRHRPFAIAFLMTFGVGFTFLVWDMLLALQVNWFSTMWGVYCFSSAVQTFLCTLVLVVLWLKGGPLKDLLPKHVIHDIGTWMVGWSCFCAYIGFSQYMLIYYANLDEETYWYVARTQHGYGWLFIADALMRWPLPFLVLMSQSCRTHPVVLRVVACLVLLGNWIDWSFIIMPAQSPNVFRNPFFGPEPLIAAGFAGLLILVVLRFWTRHGLIAKGEPKLLPAVNAEHLH
jgi:hypothetical protein